MALSSSVGGGVRRLADDRELKPHHNGAGVVWLHKECIRLLGPRPWLGAFQIGEAVRVDFMSVGTAIVSGATGVVRLCGGGQASDPGGTISNQYGSTLHGMSR
jgi:hypothetical protein